MIEFPYFHASIEGTQTISFFHATKRDYSDFYKAIEGIEIEYNKVLDYLITKCGCKMVHEYKHERIQPFYNYTHMYVVADRTGLPAIHTIHVTKAKVILSDLKDATK